MRTSEAVRLVAQREIRTRARTKAFRGITALLVLLAIAGPIVAALWPDDDGEPREVTVGALDADESFADQLRAVAGDTLKINVVPVDAVDAESALTSGRVDVVVTFPDSMAWEEEIDVELSGVVSAVLQQRAALARGADLGLEPAATAALFEPIAIDTTFVDGQTTEDDVSAAVAFLGLMLTFILPQAFGQLTLLSVVEEKSTRVIEVLLSHLRPSTLLSGKVIGLSLLALGQMAIILIGLVAGLLATDAIDVPSSVWQFVPMAVLGVTGGLIVYNTLFALLGSLISRQEDASQVMLPVFVPFMAGYIVGQTAVWGDAESLLVKVFTFVPLTAPMLLPVRVARGAIAPWEISVSIALVIATIWLLVRAAGRVYEFTLLQTGARVKWSTAIRLSRGALIDRPAQEA